MKELVTKTLMVAMMVFALCSCDNAIYDDEGDCSVTYRLKFRYDYNMKFADAFAHEVGSVHVYAFDKNGTLVWQKTDKGEALAQDNYSMTLDLPAGDYDFIAWCGLDNGAGDAESFTVPEMTEGTSTKSDLTCKLNRQYDSDGKAYVDSNLYGLYYGELSVNLPSNEDGGDYTYTMPLMKDTNHLRVILQQLSGNDVDVSLYTFTLEDENGYLASDNSLLSDENITYRTWNTESGQAGVGTNDSVQTTVKVAIADLTVSRLMADRKMYLTIRNFKGKTVVRVPFIEYALLVKGYYRDAEGNYVHMSDQEYLDRQDEYSMTFFLDEGGEWVSSSILIQQWRIVLQDHTLNGVN